MDTKGILFDRIRLQNTPGGMVWEKDENDLWHVFRCGYDFDPQAFYEITGESPAITRMIQFPWIRESVGTIAKHPSTIARRDELQKAFDKAGIPGKWESVPLIIWMTGWLICVLRRCHFPRRL